MKTVACLLACLFAIPAAAQVVATPPIGGFNLGAGGCFSQPVSYSGAAVGATTFTVNPQTFPGNGVVWQIYVSATNQVTVKVCATIAGYVNAVVYDVQQSTSGSGFITTVTATPPIISSGGTAPNINAAYQGTGLLIQASTGATTPNDCVKFDASGNTIDAGAPCATGTVTSVTATGPLTSSGGATPNISATYQGNGGKVQASTGTTTTNDCVKFDANGNTIDAGAPCAIGTVTSVTATGPLTSSGGETPNISATYQGNGAKVQASTGGTTTNDCVKFDANGNTIDAGAPCATGTVTSVTATGPLTSSGGATPNISATYQGNGAKVQASTGSTTTNDCVKFDLNGNTVDAGAPCNTGTVTNVTATGPLTSSGGATPNISATYQGNGAKVQASTGSTTTNDCVKYDANGNTIDAGAACGTPTTLAAGTTHSFSGSSDIFVCTTTCTVTPPAPSAGLQYCAMNGDNVSTVITFAAIGSSAQYENTARTAYGTAGTGTLTSSGATANFACILGLDSTHYLTVSFSGTWTTT
jgi:hypothetical protein